MPEMEIDEALYKKYEDIITRIFSSNRSRPFNPEAIFFYAFSETQMELSELYLCEFIKRYSRPHLIIDCSEKSYRQIMAEVSEIEIERKIPSWELYESMERKMRLGSGRTFVFKNPSQIKDKTKLEKVQITREIMKILDDAHFSDINTMSDVIIIDRASFLEAGWEYLSAYAKMVAPIEIPFDDLFPSAKKSLWPVS